MPDRSLLADERAKTGAGTSADVGEEMLQVA